MDIEFLPAKNNEETVKINSIYLHSSYNPSKEAERFIENLQEITKSTKYILVSEPGLGYIVPFIRNKCPNSKLIAVHYTNDIKSIYDFDYEIVYTPNSSIEDLITNIYPIQNIFETVFLKWETGAKIFSEIDSIFWTNLKQLIQKQKTLLITQQYFEKKWLINSCNYTKYAQNFLKLKSPIDIPILICASGPSLNSVIPFIQENQNSFFIICLSSAISVLNKFNIIPDLYFSTDGGYWANFHLRHLNKNIPLALTPESFCNKFILEHNTLFPLIYDDDYSSELKQIINIDFVSAKRNGTVSGTALDFALDNSTNGEIYFAGLDLCSNYGYQHSNPNELTLKNCVNETKFLSLEKRESASRFNTESLEIYENWFKNKRIPLGHNVFRLIEEKDRINNLNNIKDISINEIKSKINYSSNKKNFFSNLIIRSKAQIKKESNIYYDFIKAKINDNEFIKNVFTVDYISLKRNPENSELQEKILNEKNKLYNKVSEILNE